MLPIQGLKLTFLGRNQLVIEIFFSGQMQKCDCQKVSIKLNLLGKHKVSKTFRMKIFLLLKNHTNQILHVKASSFHQIDRSLSLETEHNIIDIGTKSSRATHEKRKHLFLPCTHGMAGSCTS